MARTVTTGGAISGYCAIGSTRIAASPAITMKIDSTAAKIGRSMKKRDIMAYRSLKALTQRTQRTQRTKGTASLALLRRVRRRFRGGLVAGLGVFAWCALALVRGAFALAGRALAVRGGRAVGDLHRPARGPHQLELH